MAPNSVPSPAPLSSSRKQTVYFAYGSNMHLVQMTARCPESRYLGRGKLRDYKWQINNRGFANIISSRGDCVEGLCYLLSQKDERQLDRKEGVPTAYEKAQMSVEIWSANAAIVGRRVSEVNEKILLNRSIEDHQQALSNGSVSSEQILTLVYVSYREIRDGDPKLEYIGRIESAIQDAWHLGVSSDYLGKEIIPVIRLVIQPSESRAEASVTRSEDRNKDDRRRSGRKSQHPNNGLTPHEPAEVRQPSDNQEVIIANGTHQSTVWGKIEVHTRNQSESLDLTIPWRHSIGGLCLPFIMDFKNARR